MFGISNLCLDEVLVTTCGVTFVRRSSTHAPVTKFFIKKKESMARDMEEYPHRAIANLNNSTAIFV